MDGAKLVTDTADNLKRFVVGRRSVWVEVFPRGSMDRIEMRILVIVGS